VLTSRLGRWRSEQPAWYPATLAIVMAWGIALRIAHLSSGTLFRDDAWVALTTRVDLSTAWKMVGASPCYVLGMRSWIGLVGDTTWLVQLPTLIVSVAGLCAIVALARWWGLSRLATVIGLGILASSRVAVEYSTHLKPYTHDILMASVLLAAAAIAQSAKGRWIFAIVCAVSMATSLTALPLVLGLTTVVGLRALRHGQGRGLIAPAVVVGAPLGAFTWLTIQQISPRLHESWHANFVDFSSWRSAFDSTVAILRGLLWGLIDTTPNLHIAGLGTALSITVVAITILGLLRRGRSSLPASGVAMAILAAAAGVIPLGTGRTDAYLYVPLLLLFGTGLDRLVELVGQRSVRHLVVAAVAAVALVGLIDRSLHRRPYPGGDFHAATSLATKTLNSGGAVLIEGTARWPWMYYVAEKVQLTFSDQYNTGFAPVVHQPGVYVMRGSQIEGGYDPAAAVDALYGAPEIVTIRSDDWEVANPLAPALNGACYISAGHRHVPGYYVDLWRYRCLPD